MALLEVACFNPESAILAYESGADRIELCDDREAGGTTPPRAWLEIVKEKVKVPVFVMIRPRGGDFNYSEHEFNQMIGDIQSFRTGADGFVFGILDANRNVDILRTKELVNLAHPLPCTFHRAFDETYDVFQAFEDVIATGCKAILTSGCAPAAHAGIETIGQLVRMSRRRITVIPGGGVRSRNVSAVRGYTRATIFHSSATSKGMSTPSKEEIRRLKQQLLGQPSLEPLETSTTSALPEGVDEADSLSNMQMSAVSIGECNLID